MEYHVILNRVTTAPDHTCCLWYLHGTTAHIICPGAGPLLTIYAQEQVLCPVDQGPWPGYQYRRICGKTGQRAVKFGPRWFSGPHSLNNTYRFEENKHHLIPHFSNAFFLKENIRIWFKFCYLGSHCHVLRPCNLWLNTKQTIIHYRYQWPRDPFH